jgi:hypothetical protein
MYVPPYIKIASRSGGRDGPPKADHFRGAPFPFRPFSFGRAKENGQASSDIRSFRFSRVMWLLERTFLCLDTKESTKGKIKAGEKMAENFSAGLKRIKYVSFLRHTRDEYSFFDAPLLPKASLREKFS